MPIFGYAGRFWYFKTTLDSEKLYASESNQQCAAQFNRSGSAWNRWKPHIHVPGTILNDQYTGSDPFEEFVQRIECGKLLTGSASKGRNGRYYYYHFTSLCGGRFKSEKANELFSNELKKLVPKPRMIEVYEDD